MMSSGGKRRPLIAANWKMYKNNEEAEGFLAELIPLLPEGSTAPEVVVCPPFTALNTVIQHSFDSQIKVAAQNMHEEDEGAFTGEVSAPMLAELGVRGVILGHSERRAYFNETDRALQNKVVTALEAGLEPILCVGETEEEREAGETERKLRNQVFQDLELVPVERLVEVVIAYEPIWAIGTGRTATPELAQDAVAFVRALVGDRDEQAAKQVRVLYGGSVKPVNAHELMSQEDIDGALVGGASLDAAAFAEIVRAALP